MSETDPAGEPPRPDSGLPRLQRVAALTAAGLLGAAVGLAILFGVTANRNRSRLPALEPADFYAARDQWDAVGPASYDVVVRVTGRQAAEYAVSVRDGAVVDATRNGQPLRQQRTMGTWSVPGMFGTIQSDVTNVEQHRAGTAGETTPQVLLRGVFDEQYGYPLRYLRTDLRRFGNNEVVSWEVLRFEVRS